jgi:2-polyprenyl-6-hydroxyphenyl methylase/3-demethylubiquinone-9 3-methyltransferase
MMSEKDRFAFGKNWQAFLAALDEERIDQAVHSLRKMLGVESLEGQRFLDLGCGSGLFSLAAHRLGADVVSVDYDAQCVACTQQLREQFASDSSAWKIQQGSVLDESLMKSLGNADVVYSWGVLHHTGDMDRAIDLAADRVRPGGLLMIAIYNDQGGASRRWLKIKQTYNRLPGILRPLWVVMIAGFYETKFALARLVKLQNPLPFREWRAKKQDRGMSVWHDWVDWIGGLPFEVATPERIIVPLRTQGFVLENLKTVGSGWGCNEYVFSKPSTTPP